MNRIFHRRSLTVRVTLLFLACSLCSMLIYSAYLLYLSYTFTQTQIEASAQTICYNVAASLDVLVDKMNHSAIILLNHVEVADAVIAIENASADEALAYYSTLSVHSSLATTTADYYHIGFYGSDGSLLYGTDLSDDLFFNTDSVSADTFSTYRYIMLAPTEHTLTVYDGSYPYVLIRAIGSLTSIDPIGYVTVSCKTRTFQSILENSYSSAHTENDFLSNLYIVDGAGNVITSLYEFDESESLYSENTSHMVQQMSTTDWTVCADIPTSYYFESFLSSILQSLLLLTLLTLSAAIIISYLLAYYLRPFKGLTNSMALVTNGDYSQRLDTKQKFEDMSLVFNGYNQMLEEIDTLINRVYRQKITTQEYQLKLLKAQINPHFLYNTLQTIEALGEINDVPEVQESASLLGDLLHYNLKEDEQVPLSSELHSAETYLKIHKIRFHNQLKFFVQLDPKVKNCIVEKFILQPLLENSILHGFGNMSQCGQISICCYKEDQNLLIDLYDDGIGIPEDQLNALQAQLLVESTDVSTSHIGILNVHRRICNLYGNNPYGITLKSTPTHGTLIRITLPYQTSLL